MNKQFLIDYTEMIYNYLASGRDMHNPLMPRTEAEWENVKLAAEDLETFLIENGETTEDQDQEQMEYWAKEFEKIK